MPDYFVHDNGGRPYRVHLSSRKNNKKKYTACVYANVHLGDDEWVGDEECDEEYESKPIYKCHYIKAFVPSGLMEPKLTNIGSYMYDKKHQSEDAIGNTILLLTRKPNKQNQYKRYNYVLFSSSGGYSFNSHEEITEFYSNNMMSDVPYPYALSESYAFVFNECMTRLKRNALGQREPYLVYYDIVNTDKRNNKKTKAQEFKALDPKRIVMKELY